jgi:hypothetical protein
MPDVTVKDVREELDRWEQWVQDCRTALAGRGENEILTPGCLPTPVGSPAGAGPCQPPDEV